MRLDKLYHRFLLQLNKLQERAVDVEANIHVMESWRTRYLTESLVHDLWQAWSRFVRELIHCSCRGCLTRSNYVVPPRLADNSWQRIGYEAMQAARRNNINPNKFISSFRQEPTWCDQKNIISILTALGPANSKQLISVFGLPLRGPKDLQIIRNSCAHKHAESMQDIKGIQIYYLSSRIHQPSDLVWQVEMKSGQVAFYKWIDDFRIIANLTT